MTGVCKTVCVFGVVMLAFVLVAAGADPQPGPPLPAPALDLEGYDPDNAEEIMENCAGCHGEFGQGGGDGIYPRLAGLPQEYLAASLRAFQSRQRLSIPMVPFVDARELPPADLRDISVFLSRIDLPTRMPDLPEETEAYQRLLVARRVINIPPVEGDLTEGERVFRSSCKKCHGSQGEGRGKVPRLAGQHTAYLRDSIGKILSGERWHKNPEKYLVPYSEQQFEDLLAFLASLDD